ncbi:MAG: DUF502 domain-containing protein [Aquabacterium sp.]|nr:MAG: DUF502 domain-containing protein [Aquabacterium sp.]TAL20178.1 MAG: DUF502 domain-containing protein [Aquabacterium sp.]
MAERSSVVRRYLITGLLTWLPLAVTVWVLVKVLGLLDGVFQWLVSALKALIPDVFHGNVDYVAGLPGLSVAVVVLALFLTGALVANIFGQWLLNRWDRLVQKIPIVKSIYTSVKQVSDTLFSSSGQAFREAVLVQYPREGSWTIAFVTGKPGGVVAEQLQGDHLSLYVPTTPNPTSGFMLIVPRADVRALDMSVDEALKYIISMGVVAPPPHLAPPAAGQVSGTAP